MAVSRGGQVACLSDRGPAPWQQCGPKNWNEVREMRSKQQHSSIQALEIQRWSAAETWDEIAELFRFLGAGAGGFFIGEIARKMGRPNYRTLLKLIWSVTILYPNVTPEQRPILKKLCAPWLNRAIRYERRRDAKLAAAYKKSRSGRLAVKK